MNFNQPKFLRSSTLINTNILTNVTQSNEKGGGDDGEDGGVVSLC